MELLLLHTLFLFLSISVVSSSQELQNEVNMTDFGTEEAPCQGNCKTIVYSSPPPPYQSIPIYGAPPPPPPLSSGQGSPPQCPPCCQYVPPQPYYYPPQPYMTPPLPYYYPPQPYMTPPQPVGYQPYYNYSGVSRSMLYDGCVLGLCFLLSGAFV